MRLEQAKEPMPDTERLFIDILQLSQGNGVIAEMVAYLNQRQGGRWKSQYSVAELSERVENQVLSIVYGPYHRDVSPQFSKESTITQIERDAKRFVQGFDEKNLPILTLFSFILSGDMRALNFKGGEFSGRKPRGQAEKDMPTTNLNDLWESKFVYYILMDPEYRAQVWGQNYGLHPTLEDMCTDMRLYYQSLRRKKPGELTDEETLLLRTADSLIEMWDKHHSVKSPIAPRNSGAT